MNQAKRVGAAFASTPIDALYSSDLKRAHWTALQIHRHHGKPAPSPTASPNKRKRDSADAPKTAEAIAGPSSPAHVDAGPAEGDGPSSAPQPSTSSAGVGPPRTTELLREQACLARSASLISQFFGSLEGSSWHESAGFHRDRSTPFADGESLDDVGRRADRIVERVVLPNLVLAATAEDGRDRHVVLVAHGIVRTQSVMTLTEQMISELSLALLRYSMDPTSPASFRTGGLQPSLEPSELEPLVPMAIEVLEHGPDADVGDWDSSAVGPMRVTPLHINNTDHLAGLARQKGGIGSSAFDAKQRDLRAFFSGASSSA